MYKKAKRVYDKSVMISWKVENPNRLLSEIKNKCSGTYTTVDLRWALEHNRCFVNKKMETFASSPVKKGDLITFWPEQKPTFCTEKSRILYEDDFLLVYNKPPFLSSENLEKLTQCTLVHRLDRDTTGALLLAKTPSIQTALEKQFKERSIEKEYLALVEGCPGKSGIIKGKIGPLYKREGAVIWGMSSAGQWSQTQWKCIQIKENRSLLLCVPLTGRTHQIRVHLKHLGYPIIGDYTYGPRTLKAGIFRPMLHAYRLTFTHPHSGQRLTLKAALPTDFAHIG